MEREKHHLQGLTNPLSGCPGQVKKFAGQVKYFLTCPEKCIRYIGKTKETQFFVAEVLYRTSRSNFDLSSPDLIPEEIWYKIWVYSPKTAGKSRSVLQALGLSLKGKKNLTCVVEFIQLIYVFWRGKLPVRIKMVMLSTYGSLVNNNNICLY